MQRRVSGMVAAAGSLLAASAVAAADLPLRAAPPPIFVVQDWSGFYLGAQVGTVIGRGRDQTVASGDGGLILSPNFGGRGGRTGNALGRFEERDLFSGGHGGYNWQSGSVVYGVEGDIDLLGRIDDVLVSGRARLGFGTPQFLVYGTAGVAYLSLQGGLAGTFVGGNGGNGGNGGPGGDGGQGGNGFGTLVLATPGGDRFGFVGGGGVEMRLSPQVSAGVEALYYSFDGAALDPGLPRDFLTVRGRLSFHLNPTGGPVGPLGGGEANWAGGYAGGHFGALTDLTANTISSVSLAPGEAGAPGTRPIDGGGGGGGGVAFAGIRQNASVLGGVHLGYNWQTAGIVYGGEADASFADSDAYRYLGTIRGRLGFTGAGALFYGTAGVAFNRNESVRTIFGENGGNGGDGGAVAGAGGAGGNAFALRANETQVGFVVGGGVEAKLTERLSAGAEALYYNFGNARLPALPASNGGRFFDSAAGNEALVVRTRLSFSFSP